MTYIIYNIQDNIMIPNEIWKKKSLKIFISWNQRKIVNIKAAISII